MGNVQPREESVDAPDSLKRRIRGEVHGERRHVNQQTQSLFKLQDSRRQEIKRLEDIEKKRQLKMDKGKGQVFGLWSDDFSFPGPTLVNGFPSIFKQEVRDDDIYTLPPTFVHDDAHQGKVEQLVDAKEEEVEQPVDAKEKEVEQPVSQTLSDADMRDIQMRISQRLEKNGFKIKRMQAEVEAKLQNQEETFKERGGKQDASVNSMDHDIPLGPPVPKEGHPGFIGIEFIDPELVYPGQDSISDERAFSPVHAQNTFLDDAVISPIGGPLLFTDVPQQVGDFERTMQQAVTVAGQ